MPTMYETIRDLPLFKGTNTEQISSFLEKTNVEFVRFSPGDIIVGDGVSCDGLQFILSGEVLSRRTLANGKATLIMKHSYGAVFTPCFMFGIDTLHPQQVEAISEGSCMVIKKSQYFELLKTDSIYMLNYINYLSYNVQRAQKGFAYYCGGNIESWLTAILSVLAERRAYCTEIHTTRANLSEILSLTSAQVNSQLEDLDTKTNILLEEDLEGILKFKFGLRDID